MSVSPSSSHCDDFEHYRRDVYGWAFRLLGQHHDALDVTQDVFLRWLKRSGDISMLNPRAWLRTVTINRSIDLIRERRREIDVKHTPRLRLVPVEQGDVERDEIRNDLIHALESLTDSQRNVFIAKVFDGLTFARIAEDMSVAVPTVKTHYLRAVSTLRDRLSLRWKPESTKIA